VQRANHHGNVQTGQLPVFNWTIPAGAGGLGVSDASNCVLRVRYNLTTADTQVCENKTITTKTACLAAGKQWSAAFLDSTFDNLVDDNGNGADANGNQNPPLLESNPDMDLGGFLNDGGGTDSLLQLNVDTRHFGRTFEDRSHVFDIQSRPAQIASNTRIFNLNVRGKRGSQEDVYPALPFDFAPNDLVVGANDMVHIQWTGSDDTFNDGFGTAGEERHNIVQIGFAGQSTGMNPSTAEQASMFDVEWGWNPDASAQFGGARDKDELTKQAALVKQTGCLTEGQINNDQQRQNCQKLNAAAATVDMGIVKFKAGAYEYFSTRNHAFSERSQKGHLTVLTSPTVPPGSPVQVQATPLASGGVEVTWAMPGSTVGYTGFDGKEYWGMEQQNAPVAEYKVEYSLEGGAYDSWVEHAGCPACAIGAATCSCTVDGLPASTTALFRVRAGSGGGWSTQSDLAAAKTLGAGPPPPPSPPASPSPPPPPPLPPPVRPLVVDDQTLGGLTSGHCEHLLTESECASLHAIEPDPLDSVLYLTSEASRPAGCSKLQPVHLSGSAYFYVYNDASQLPNTTACSAAQVCLCASTGTSPPSTGLGDLELGLIIGGSALFALLLCLALVLLACCAARSRNTPGPQALPAPQALAPPLYYQVPGV